MKSIYIFLAAAFAGMGGLNAADSPTPTSNPESVDRTKPPKAEPLPKVNFPDAKMETLGNGLRLYILPNHREPTVTYRLLIKSGDAFDGSKPGLVTLTADMLNKGTDTLTAQEFAQKTDFMGASVEAGSSDDALSITATGLSKYSADLLQFVHDAALKPAFRDEELKRQKRQLTSALAQKKMDPEDLAVRLRDKLLYGAHPYGAFATPESVQTVTRDDLMKFHKAHFLPNNASLVVVGDIDPAEVKAAILKAFGDWQQGAVPKLDAPPIPEVKGITVHVVNRPASVQSNVIVAGRGVPRDNPDTPELGVVSSVLGGGFSGRLFANLREKHGYTYGAYSGFQEKKLGGTFSATAEVRNAVTGPATGEILNELNRIAETPIPQGELELQRNYLAGNFLMSLESNQRTAERIQEIDLYNLPTDFYKNYASRLVSITPEQASTLAKKYIDPKDVAIVVVGEAKEVLPQVEKFGTTTVYDTDLKPTPPTPATPASPPHTSS